MGSRLILFADDSEPMRRLVRAILEPAGYQVMTAEDGNQALAQFAVHARDIDLVILDNQMPGHTGEEVLAQIRERDNDLPVLMASGFEKPGDGIKDPHLSYLTKPYMPADLIRTVGKLLK